MSRTVKPLSPDEAAQQAAADIPDFVIEAVNNLLKKKLNNGYATIFRDDIIDEIIRTSKQEVTRQQIFDNKWLDFEPIFGDVGWDVEYDKPGYNETYKANFKFAKKKP